jgi:tRNA-modifying protein YgfZ
MFVSAASLGVITITGDDALTFLQGQATPDFRKLNKGEVVFGGFCSPKGRIIANGWFQNIDEGYRLIVSCDMVDSLVKRLGLYVLRSKVSITDASDNDPVYLAVGNCADSAEDKVGANGVSVGPLKWRVRHSETLTILAGDLESQGSFALRGSTFNLAMVREGIPLVTAQTSDLYIPQMLAMERWGGLSFDKGCYTGQEIVTRTQFLGRVKRGLYRFNSDSASQLRVDDEIRERAGDKEAIGKTLMTAELPSGGVAGMAVIKETDADVMKAYVDGHAIDLERVVTDLI